MGSNTVFWLAGASLALTLVLFAISRGFRIEKIRFLNHEMTLNVPVEVPARPAFFWIAVFPLVFSVAAFGYALYEEMRPKPTVRTTLFLDDDLSSWYAADADAKSRLPPTFDANAPTYYGGSDAEVLVPGLWAGDITAGIQDPLVAAGIQRDIFDIVPQLAAARVEYEQAENRTGQLDTVWSLIPYQRRMQADLIGFRAFTRILYPDPNTLSDPAVIQLRDELIDSLSRHWDPPSAPRDTDDGYVQRLFYDLLLWRTNPVFRLRVQNKSDFRLVLDQINLTVERFEPMAETTVSGPIDIIADISFELDGADTVSLSQRLDVAVGAGDVADVLVKIENSASKGAYALHLDLISDGSVLWSSDVLNLIYTY